MGPGKDGKADGVHVLLKGRVDDHFRRLVQPRINDLETSVSQGPGDHLRTAIVTVQTRFADEYSDFAFHKCRGGVSPPDLMVGWYGRGNRARTVNLSNYTWIMLLSEDLSERPHHLAHTGIGFYRFQDIWNQVVLPLGRRFQFGQGALDRGVIPVRLHLL